MKKKGGAREFCLPIGIWKNKLIKAGKDAGEIITRKKKNDDRKSRNKEGKIKKRIERQMKA
ncbi:MAG: hypothetical protein LBD15_04030 [Holosporales bacterium]|nr:hypothetical protein [Holosporales bacterium]